MAELMVWIRGDNAHKMLSIACAPCQMLVVLFQLARLYWKCIPNDVINLEGETE